jgi:hypothetical protein
MLSLHCIVSSNTPLKTWRWPSARPKHVVFSLNKKAPSNITVVFWLTIPFISFHISGPISVKMGKIRCPRSGVELFWVWWPFTHGKPYFCYGRIKVLFMSVLRNRLILINFALIRSVLRFGWENMVESIWNVMAHGDAREGKWRGNWWMEWVASTLHTTSEHGLSSITTADPHTSAAGSRLNWRPPADLNGLVRFRERRNLVSARVPSHFKRTLQPGRPQMTIRRMSLIYRITTSFNAHSEYVMRIAFHGKNGYVNAFQCYLARALLGLFVYR